LIATTSGYSADLAKWSFTGQLGDQVGTPVTTIDASVQSASGITRGGGVAVSTTANSMNSSGWTTNGSIDAGDYYEFTITPAAGMILNIDTLYLAERRSGTGIRNFELRSSLDSYGTTIGTAVAVPDDTNTRQQVLALGSGFDSVSSAVTFRLYGYASEASGGTWRIENNTVKGGLVLEGSTVAPAGTLSVSLVTNPIFESGGATSTSGTVTRTGDLTNPLTVNLSSSNPAQATVSGPTVNIPALSATSDSFTVTAVNDSLPDGNVAVTITASAATYSTGTASLTVNDDGDQAAVLISQYYEGAAGTDRYIELYNPNATPSTLTGYVLTGWNNAAAESWKTNGNTPTNQISLSAVTVPAHGYFLIKGTGATIPSYAASSADIADSTVGTGFNGNDSIVLYSSGTFSTSNIVDAVSFTNSGNEGLDTSFYRSGTAVGYNLTSGSTVLTFPSVWITKPLADVNSATASNAWYLQASVVLESLSLSIDLPSIFENPLAGTAVATGTVTRTGSTANAVDVTVSVNDSTEASLPQTLVTIPATQSSVQFSINGVDDQIIDGDKTVTVTVQAASYISDTETIIVKDDGLDPATFTNLVINEVDSDTPGTDVLEFVELYNKSNQSQTLTGLVLVFYNGGDISSYRTIDLSGHTIPANGFFVVGNPGVAGVGITFANGTLQNGADAVALYAAEPSQIPNGTQVTSAGGTLVDAVVYDNDNADNTALILTLTPGKPQINENSNVLGSTQSLSRLPDGGAAFDTTLYVVQAPSPGLTNVLPPPYNYPNWINGYYSGVTDPLTIGFGADPDHDGISNGVEALIGGNPSTPGVFATTELTQTGNTFSFLYPKSKTVPAGVTASYDWSSDLITWQASTVASSGGINVTLVEEEWDSLDPNVTIYKVTATVTAGTTSKIFVRVAAHN